MRSRQVLIAAVLGFCSQTAAQQLEIAVGEAAAQTRSRPTSADNWQKLGLAHYLGNHFDEAISAFGKAVQLNPKLWPSHLFLGVSRYRKNEFPAALSSLRIADRLAPPSAQGRDDLDYWLGAALIANRSPLEGLAVLERLLARSPGHVSALQLATENYADAASSIWNVVAEQAFDSSAGQEVHGYALESEGSGKTALQAFERSAQLAPARPGPGTAIARLKLREGDLSGARQALERELKLAPSSPHANLYAGMLAVTENRLAAAVPFLKTASAWMPDNEEPLLALTQVYLALHQNAEALECARRAIALDGASIAAHELLLTVLVSLGDTAAASAERERWQARK